MGRVIDRKARRQAHIALTRFLNGVTTNDDFQSEYPNPGKTSDRAIRAIDTMVWNLYSDHQVHTLSETHAPDAIGYQLLERCLLFLESTFPYEWSVDNFIMAGEPDRFANLLSFGFTGRRHRHRERVIREALAKEGEYSVWPFISYGDFVAAGGTADRQD